VVSKLIPIPIIGPVIGNLASQAFLIAIGQQDKFSWKSLAISVIAAAITPPGTGSLLVNVAQAVAANAATQGIAVVTGLQDKFSWSSVAAAGVMAGVSGAASRGLDRIGVGGGANLIVSNALAGIASAGARSLLTGTSFGDNVRAVLPDIIGQTVGNMIGAGFKAGFQGSGGGGGEGLAEEARSGPAADRYWQIQADGLFGAPSYSGQVNLGRSQNPSDYYSVESLVGWEPEIVVTATRTARNWLDRLVSNPMSLLGLGQSPAARQQTGRVGATPLNRSWRPVVNHVTQPSRSGSYMTSARSGWSGWGHMRYAFRGAVTQLVTDLPRLLTGGPGALAVDGTNLLFAPAVAGVESALYPLYPDTDDIFSQQLRAQAIARNPRDINLIGTNAGRRSLLAAGIVGLATARLPIGLMRGGTAEGRIVTTGASRTLADLDFDAAETAYNSIRMSNSDVMSIAQNTGMRGFQVGRIKEHLFYNTHRLDGGVVGLFDAHPEIANAWYRLEGGAHTAGDIQLLRHELFESRFEGIFRTDWRTAHDAANRAGRPSGVR
jgi:hypothetical protein